jgi:hypothetical protein
MKATKICLDNLGPGQKLKQAPAKYKLEVFLLEPACLVGGMFIVGQMVRNLSPEYVALCRTLVPAPCRFWVGNEDLA